MRMHAKVWEVVVNSKSSRWMQFVWLVTSLKALEMELLRRGQSTPKSSSRCYEVVDNKGTADLGLTSVCLSHSD
ncbi:hypothetical protein KIN20_028214 [Parelaphostrongylus tenuis]|uniref:Uncharacterized protein n=1 Tax=Parelaphostrongylus tenuis TaxID=148309 RepID=A0AAD5R0F7_PARTN|nr:hypothetical protein KIN20_028214 [Parelaphostrongylus tenuis]